MSPDYKCSYHGYDGKRMPWRLKDPHCCTTCYAIWVCRKTGAWDSFDTIRRSFEHFSQSVVEHDAV